MAQFLTPMNDLVDSVASNRKFRRASKEQVEGELRRLKRENPKQVRALKWHGTGAYYAHARLDLSCLVLPCHLTGRQAGTSPN